MKKTFFLFILFLVYTRTLVSFDLGQAINVGSSLLTGGPSAGASALLGGGNGSGGYDMSGFDSSAGAASGVTEFNPAGFTAMSDAEVAQMRSIANSMPVDAPVTGPTIAPAAYGSSSYGSTQTYYDPSQAGYNSTFVDPGYEAPVQAPYSMSSDFSGAAPVDYSQQPLMTRQYPVQAGGMVTTQQFDAMGNPIVTAQPTVAATTPTTTVVIQQAPANTTGATTATPYASSSSEDSSAFGALGDSGGGMLVGAGALTAVGGTTAVVRRRSTPNRSEQLTIPPEQAHLIPSARMPIIDEDSADYGDIIRSVDKNGNTKLKLKTISKTNPIWWTWSVEKRADYQRRLRTSKEELKELQKAQSGIKSLSNPYYELQQAEMLANPMLRNAQSSSSHFSSEQISQTPLRRTSFTPTPVRRTYSAGYAQPQPTAVRRTNSAAYASHVATHQQIVQQQRVAARPIRVR